MHNSRRACLGVGIATIGVALCLLTLAVMRNQPSYVYVAGLDFCAAGLCLSKVLN